MNLKFRFALLFTFFVAIILLITSASIYILYFNYRSGDHYRRLRSEALNISKEFYEIKKIKDSIVLMNNLQQSHKNVLYEERVAVFDSGLNVLFKEPDTLSNAIDASLFEHIQKSPAGEYRFKNGNMECSGIYDDRTGLYIYISAIDRYGLNRLSTLKYILAGVFAASLFITAIFSFFFARAAFRPLSNLGRQMQKVNEMNLSERLEEGKTKNEVTQIAINFNSMLDRLKKGFDAQKNFVHHASHELRTPLATMLAFTESALRKDLDKDGYRKVLYSLKEDQEGMIELTNSLLLLSQYEKIKFSRQWPAVRIDELLYDAISIARKLLPGIEIELEFAGLPGNEEDLIIHTNEALLKVAFTNLFKNAWQYSIDKKVIVAIDADEGKLEVHVDNAGEHLQPAEIERLKVPFFRGTNAGNVKGFGLGLSIVHRIVSLHSAELSYTPVQPNINRFTIHFHQNGQE